MTAHQYPKKLDPPETLCWSLFKKSYVNSIADLGNKRAVLGTNMQLVHSVAINNGGEVLIIPIKENYRRISRFVAIAVLEYFIDCLGAKYFTKS